VVDVDPLGLNTEAEQGIALGGQVLLIGGASSVPDKQCAHGAPPELARRGRRMRSGSGIRQRLTHPSKPLSASGRDAEQSDPSPQRVEHLLNKR